MNSGVAERGTPLARARAVAPRIRAAADEIDEGRRIPTPLADELIDLGMFRLLVPRSLGGEQMDWLDYLDVVRTIAYADASVGWCVNQGAVFATTSCRAPAALADEIWRDPRTVVANGPPQGVTSEVVPGGHRLSGRWNFSSGCRHANWMAALNADRGAPPRLHLIPKDQVRLVDVWQVQGLRGTGSFSFEVKDLFVPESRTMPLNVPPYADGAIYLTPQGLLFACGFGCVALGNARAAIDSTEEFASDKRPRFGSRPLSQDPVVQQAVGKAEAIWRGAKALLHHTVGEVWNAIRERGAITLQERVELRMAGTHAIRESARAVDICYNLSGSSSIFADRAIQRRFQDAHVITQQVQGREAHYETVGQFFVGEEPRGVI